VGKPQKSNHQRGPGFPIRQWDTQIPLSEQFALLDLGSFMGRDINGTIRLWSPGCERLYGWTAKEAIGQLSHELLKTIFPIPQARIEAALERNGHWIGELRHRRRDGAEVIVAVHKALRRGEDGRPSGVIEVIVDVTAQRRAELALLDSEARFHTYFDNSADWLFHVRADGDGRFVYEAINSAGLIHAGITAEQARGRTPEEVFGPIVGSAITAGLRQAVETGKPYRFEPTFDLGSGKVTYDGIYMPLRNEAGEITGVLGSARDISEHRRVEALLRQSQKMDALGHLASGVAHDFNNVLGGLLGSLELLEDHVTSDHGKAFITSCFKSVERGRALVARLLAYARQQPMVNAHLDINVLIAEVVELLASTLGGSVRIEKYLAPNLWPAVVDRNQIELAILNLAINSRDAMPSGGTLTIETRNETVSERQSDGLPLGQYAVIAIIDNGEGMTPEVLARAVDPFFSTKSPDKGTGLGLSTVYGLARQLGGGLRIASSPRDGTCVTLYLPRADTQAPAASSDMS
jgi:PAS domain S-box-containing protein